MKTQFNSDSNLPPNILHLKLVFQTSLITRATVARKLKARDTREPVNIRTVHSQYNSVHAQTSLVRSERSPSL